MMVIEKETAISKGLTKYFTGIACKNGHVAARQVKNNYCVECEYERAVRYRQKTQHQHSKKWYRENVKHFQAYRKDWYEKNKERISQQSKEYRRSDTGRLKRCINDAKRRSSLLNATPSWVDEQKIESVYEEAIMKTNTTGEQYHVDHFYPLNGENVCGLHIASNLQVITEAENLLKGNKHPEQFYD